MTDVLMFHHAHGLTPGLRSFVDQLVGDGHVVHLPDLYEGEVFDDLEAGVAHAEAVGFEAIIDRGVAAAEGLPDRLFVIGWSLGVLPAQKLAQTRPGVVGAVFIASCVPPSMLGSEWPPSVRVQIHGMDADPFFVGEGDIEAAREVVAVAEDGELFLYPGDGHLFADPSVDGYDADAAELVVERILEFLDRIG